MVEVVDAETGAGRGFFRTFKDAAESSLTGAPGWLFEVWQLSDDDNLSRVMLLGAMRVPEPGR